MTNQLHLDSPLTASTAPKVRQNRFASCVVIAAEYYLVGWRPLLSAFDLLMPGRPDLRMNKIFTARNGTCFV
jgi:hypothetical protein